MKKQATYGDYVITINDDSSVSVTYQNEECSNAKKALREVSENAGFAFDAGWNTRQFGSKLVDFLQSQGGVTEKKDKISGPSITITPNTFITSIYEEFYEVYPYIHLRILMEGKDMFDAANDVDPTLTLAECGPEELMNYDVRKKEGVISLDGSRTINELIEDFNQYGLNAYLYHIDAENLELGRMYSFDRTVADYNEECESCECPPYKVGDEWPSYDDEDDDDDDDSEEEENAAASLSVSEQFAILAYHIANLDGEVKKDELDMIVMVVQNFDVFEGPEVMGRLMQERMGINQYDVDDVLYAVREEHHVTMFQALAMVSVSDFNLTKEKKNILHVLSEAWDLREDKCNEFLGDLIEQVNEAYPGKLVIE